MKLGLVTHTVGMMLITFIIMQTGGDDVVKNIGVTAAVGIANLILFIAIATVVRMALHVWEQIQRG